MKRVDPHPMAATIFFLTDGIRRLRTIAADAQAEQAEAMKQVKQMKGLSHLSTKGKATNLWRGMRNMGTTNEFETEGGAECAPMSTTPDMAIAITYGASKSSLLFKILCSSFMNMGADISYLSAFPNEKEILFPPLTYLRPTGRVETVRLDVGAIYDASPAMAFTVVEVEPQM